MGAQYHNDFLKPIVTGGLVSLLCAIALVALWPAIAQAGCTNILAVRNVNSQKDANDRSIPPLLAYCSGSLQIGETTNIALIRQRGLYMWQRDGVEAAISGLRLAADQGATDPLLLVYLGLAEVEANRLAQAVETLRKVVNVDRLLERRGQQQLEREAYEEALATYLVTTQVTPDSAAAWRGLGRAYYGLGEFKAAVAAYEMALALASDDPEAHYELGMLLWELKDHEGAIGHLKQAVELTPERTLTGRRNILALVKAQRIANLHAEALRTAQIAVERFSKSPDAYYELGETLRLLGKSDAALEAYEQAIQLRPSNAHYYFVSGLAYLQLSDYEAALEALAKAVSMKPQNKWYLYHYGRILEETENFCDAAYQYRRALEVDPAYQLPRDGLRSLESRGMLSGCMKEPSIDDSPPRR